MAKSVKSGPTHLGRKSVFSGDEIKGESPAVGKGGLELVFGDFASVGGTNRPKGRSEEVAAHFVSRGQTTIQIENHRFDHARYFRNGTAD